MKRLLLAVCMGLVGVQGLLAQSPTRLVHTTGVLRDASGAIRTGSVAVTFAIYAEPQGGEPLWLETQTLELDAAGRYSTLLGLTQPEGLPVELFSGPEARWLAVAVNGEPEGPRTFWASVPYSLNAETVGGLPASAFVLTPEYQKSIAAAGGDIPTSRPSADRDGSPLGTAEVPSPLDFVVADDLIVQGSACIGLDCVNGEVFGFDTIRLKENNTRIQFDDTSGGGFPTNNWQIRANSSAGGGASFLAFVDQGATGNSETGTIVFEVDAGAPANALKVDSSGRVGIRTATPVLDVHVNTSNTPAMRLEQNSSGGFTAQTWDIAGNEANFFVRDVTGGSRLPFRIRPGAPTSSIDIAASGNVGMGTASPAAGNLHIFRSASNADATIALQQTGGTVPAQWIMKNNAVTGRLTFGAGATVPFKVAPNAAENLLRVGVLNINTVDINGNLVVTGQCSEVDGGCAPDYVFEPDYELRPLADLEAFLKSHKHLPGVPSASEFSANGINVRDMNYALLKKVEELVLYTLQQQKTIDRLEQRLRRLEAEKQ
jgi:hypothetical protein